MSVKSVFLTWTQDHIFTQSSTSDLGLVLILTDHSHHQQLDKTASKQSIHFMRQILAGVFRGCLVSLFLGKERLPAAEFLDEITN